MRSLADRPHALKFEGAGRTRQSSRDECDINIMMKKYQRSGIAPAVNPFPATYGDFSQVDSFQAAQHQIASAEQAFAGLSSEIRSRFGNDPKQLLVFLEDHANRVEAEELGLIPVTTAVKAAEEAPEGDKTPTEEPKD